MTPQCQDYLPWHFPMDVRRPHLTEQSNLRGRIKIVQEIHRPAIFWKATIIEDLWQKATCPERPLQNMKPLFLFRDRVCLGIILVVVYGSYNFNWYKDMSRCQFFFFSGEIRGYRANVVPLLASQEDVLKTTSAAAYDDNVDIMTTQWVLFLPSANGLKHRNLPVLILCQYLSSHH